MTKKQLNAFITKTLAEAGYGRGYHYQAHIYTDMKHWEEGVGDLDSLYDFMDWSDAKKHVSPGYVFDVYIYRGRGIDCELWANEVIQLPGGE